MTSLVISCNNDLNILDDYKETPIIYALLNSGDSIQYIRIEKAYLGPGNALLMAQQPDSIYYDTAAIEVSLVKYKNNSFTDTLKLAPTNQFPKDEGLFVNFPHLIYITDGKKLLDEDANYYLIFHNKRSNTTTTAKTPIVKKVSLNPLTPSPLPDVSSTINFASDKPFVIHLISSANCKFLSLMIRIHYTETILGTTQSKQKTLDYFQSQYVTSSTTGGEKFDYSLSGQDFFRFLGRNIKKDPTVKRSASLLYMDFIFTAGAEEFYTYYIVNNQSSTVGDHIPEYTNLSNGKGIFSSRSVKIYPEKMLNNASIDSLVLGQYTKGLFN